MSEASTCTTLKQTYSQQEIDRMSTNDLLLAYKRTGCPDLKWPLVLRYQGMIKTIALQIRGVYSNFAQVDDIISEGLITLTSSIDKFDPDKGIKFETFAAKRIRGMIIDLARRQDWVPRSIRKRTREIDEASGNLYSRLGRFPTDQELADQLQIPLARYQEDISHMALSNLLSLEALLDGKDLDISGMSIPCSNTEGAPELVLQEAELQKVLIDGISSLRENEQLVLSLYYQKNFNMKKIAQIMEVSEPRVSQIHTKAILKLRSYLGRYMQDES